jgi:hypothetical protein
MVTMAEDKIEEMVKTGREKMAKQTHMTDQLMCQIMKTSQLMRQTVKTDQLMPQTQITGRK